MADVDVSVPVRIRLVGTPNAEDLQRLEVAVARLVSRRLGQAQQALAGPQPGRVTDPAADTRDMPAWRYQADLDAEPAVGGCYRVMSYQGPPRPVRVPVTTRGTAGPPAAAAGSPARVQAALRRISGLLDTGIVDWAVTDAEARQVMSILTHLAPEDLLRVVQAMRVTDRWAILRRNLPADVDDDIVELQHRMDPHRGYVMAGDTLRVEVAVATFDTASVSRQQKTYTSDYFLYAGRLAPPLLDTEFDVAGVLLEEIPDRFVPAYLAELIDVEWVKVAVVARGSLYAPLHGPVAGLVWSASRPVNRAPHDQARLDKLSELLAFVAEVPADDKAGQAVAARYRGWIKKHYRTPEFLRQTGPALWSASRQDDSPPVAVAAVDRFLELAAAKHRLADVAAPAERQRLVKALTAFLSWVNRQTDETLAHADPARVWDRFYARQVVADVRAEVAEKVRRQREADARAAEKVDWEAAGRKLDAVVELMKIRMWRAHEPYTIEDHERGVGYLVWESAKETSARDLIARGFLHDMVARMDRKDFTTTSVTADFDAWLAAHPREYEAYLLARSNPVVEKYGVAIDIPAWQTTIEVAVGFIPVVGSIVAAGEATFGYDLFGHELSTVDRAILGASVLLPAAAKAFKAGHAAVTVSTLTREYGLSAREADAAYRALTKVRPGTAGARLLEDAAADVKAGRPVSDAKRLNELGDLFKDMGMTERATADELRLGANEAALEGHAGRAGQEAADLFAAGDEVAELTEALERDAASPGVKGVKRPTIAETAVPTRKRIRLDIEHIARPGERQQVALARVRRLMGKRIVDTPLKDIWERARAKVVGGRSLETATRQEMFDLYNKVRVEFWTQVRADTDAVRFLEEIGFEFPATGKAPLVKVVDPAPGLVGFPKASEIPIQERRVSLDHNLEKALGENYRRAIDADNLTFEFHNPNSNRETVQVKFKLRPTAGVSE